MFAETKLCFIFTKAYRINWLIIFGLRPNPYNRPRSTTVLIFLCYFFFFFPTSLSLYFCGPRYGIIEKGQRIIFIDKQVNIDDGIKKFTNFWHSVTFLLVFRVCSLPTIPLITAIVVMMT